MPCPPTPPPARDEPRRGGSEVQEAAEVREVPDVPGAPALGALADLVRRLERDGRVRPRAADGGHAPAAVATGWARLDRQLGTFEGAPGLARGALHEWLGLSPPHRAPRADARPAPRGEPWTPPLTLLAHLAGRALDERLARAGGHAGSVLWIGRAVWPYPAALLGADALREPTEAAAHGRWEPGDGGGSDLGLELELILDERPCPGTAAERPLFARSLLVAPPDAAARLWAVDAALRCPTVTAVVADASGFDMAATRRLALAANTGEALALLARPPHEERELSAAATRWRVSRAGDSLTPCWRLELLRAKPPQQRARSAR